MKRKSYSREVETPLEIKASLLALKRNGKINFVLFLDLKISDRNFSKFPDGLFI